MPHAFPTRRSSDLEKLGTTDDKEIDAATRSILAQFEGYAKLNKKIPAELLPSLASMDAPGRLADTIAAHLNPKLEDKQEVLESADAQERNEHEIGRAACRERGGQNGEIVGVREEQKT